MQRINYLLEQRHWQKSLGALDCKATAYTSANPMAGTLGGFDEEDVKVTWLSRALMTVTESAAWIAAARIRTTISMPIPSTCCAASIWTGTGCLTPMCPASARSAAKSAALLTLVKQAVDQGPDASKADQHPNLEDCADLWPEYLALGAQAPGALSLSVSGGGIPRRVPARMPRCVQALTPYLKPGGEAYLVRD